MIGHDGVCPDGRRKLVRQEAMATYSFPYQKASSSPGPGGPVR
jgi:hypothetical protein